MAKVFLIGAGPGALDLLTLRAAKLLEQADAVFYDALVSPEVIALAKNAEKFAVGKRCGKHSTAQKFINKRLVDAAQKYERIVRVKGGDPMLFARAHEELDALAAAGIDVEVVPGVTAALAASAQIGVSLTRRGVARNVVFLTPRVGDSEQPGDWIVPALQADTAVVYMGAGQAGMIAQSLIARGKPADTPVAVVENASLPESSVAYCTLARLPETAARGGNGPAVILLGAVLREKLAAQEALAQTALQNHRLRG
jgi:uroporphyrin-III C-methyltransferase